MSQSQKNNDDFPAETSAGTPFPPAGALTKGQLRREILKRREEVSYSEMLSVTRAVREHVRTWSVFRSAACICCYISVRNEMPTPGIILRALEIGKKVIVPKVFGDDLRFFEIRSLTEDLSRGTFGVLEPIESRCAEVPASEADVCLIPGVVFDERGNRIGYGKGYYDRFLRGIPASVPTLGLAYDFQVFREIPCCATDVPVRWLVTPSRGIFPAK